MVVADGCRVGSGMTDLEEGWILDGRYRLGSLLGVGGMARVYVASDRVLERRVADNPDCYRPNSVRIAGQRSCHGAAASYAAEARSTRASSSRRPTICSPIGRPSSVKPAGTVAAG
jgi:hypothetical protein